jgi:hypothetical protein
MVCSRKMKATQIIVLIVLLAASGSKAQENPSSQDSAAQVQDSLTRALTVDVAFADRISFGAAVLYFGAGYEVPDWRFAIALGYTLPGSSGSGESASSEINEQSFTAEYRVLSDFLVLNVGLKFGNFEMHSGGGLSLEHVYQNSAFVAPTAELGVSAGSFSGGLMYHRRISIYRPTDVVGLWLRYRFLVS